MSAPSYIRRHINNLIGDNPFSIRDFLIYGPRHTIDQVFHKLVEAGRLIRVARGVYIKSTAPKPSVMEVAQVKAAAFGKKIVTHGLPAAERLLSNGQQPAKLVFACSGSTSSFRVGKQVVYFVRTSARQLQLGDSPVGLAVRALWHLGRRACSVDFAAEATASFRATDQRALRLAAASMPAWMREYFARLGRMNCQRRDLEPQACS